MIVVEADSVIVRLQLAIFGFQGWAWGCVKEVILDEEMCIIRCGRSFRRRREAFDS